MKNILTAFILISSGISFAQTKTIVVSQKKTPELKTAEEIPQPETVDSVHVIYTTGREIKTEPIQVSPAPVQPKSEPQKSPVTSTSKKPE